METAIRSDCGWMEELAVQRHARRDAGQRDGLYRYGNDEAQWPESGEILQPLADCIAGALRHCPESRH